MLMDVDEIRLKVLFEETEKWRFNSNEWNVMHKTSSACKL